MVEQKADAFVLHASGTFINDNIGALGADVKGIKDGGSCSNMTCRWRNGGSYCNTPGLGAEMDGQDLKALGIGDDAALMGVLADGANQLSVQVERQEQAAEDIHYLFGKAKSRME